MDLWTALKLRLAAALSGHADAPSDTRDRVEDDRPQRDVKKLLLVIGLIGLVNWVV